MYSRGWVYGGYLTRYLEAIRALDCRNLLAEECKIRPYQVSAFNEMVYDRWCGHEKALFGKCLPIVRSALSSDGGGDNVSWSEAVERIGERSRLAEDKIGEPCVQIGMYEGVLRKASGAMSSLGEFVELREIQAPFCGVAWCGANRKHGRHLALRHCFSSRLVEVAAVC